MHIYSISTFISV